MRTIARVLSGKYEGKFMSVEDVRENSDGIPCFFGTIRLLYQDPVQVELPFSICQIYAQYEEEA